MFLKRWMKMADPDLIRVMHDKKPYYWERYGGRQAWSISMSGLTASVEIFGPGYRVLTGELGSAQHLMLVDGSKFKDIEEVLLFATKYGLRKGKKPDSAPQPALVSVPRSARFVSSLFIDAGRLEEELANRQEKFNLYLRTMGEAEAKALYWRDTWRSLPPEFKYWLANLLLTRVIDPFQGWLRRRIG